MTCDMKTEHPELDAPVMPPSGSGKMYTLVFICQLFYSAFVPFFLVRCPMRSDHSLGTLSVRTKQLAKPIKLNIHQRSISHE